MSAALEPVTDWRAHYKAVRARLYTAVAKPTSKPDPDPAPAVSECREENSSREPEIDVGFAMLYIIPIGPTVTEPFYRVSNIETFRQKLDEICEKYAVTVAEIMGNQRNGRIVRARQHFMYELKTNTTWSLPEIARRLNGRDHTSVLWGVRRHEALIEQQEGKVGNAVRYVEHRKERVNEARLRREARV